MLYPTMNQHLMLFALVVGGFLAGIVFDVFRFLSMIFGNDKVLKHFFDFLSTILASLLLFLTNLWLNYGLFRIYVVCIFVISFAVQRFISKFLWTKLISKWYSYIAKRSRKGGRKNRNKY